MKRLVLILCVGVTGFALAQGLAFSASKNTKVEQEVIALVRELVSAQKNYDPGTMDRIFAPDYVEVSPVGEVDQRAKVLSFYTPDQKKNGPGELLSYELDEISVRTYGDVAVVLARLPFTVKGADGQTSARAFRCVFVCRKQKGRWRLVSTQYTSIRTQPQQKS